ncbi:MAG: hypothetical protein HOJ07_06540 [Rhodospirillaceae bacterium]|nr:hypothetical protein [Rhodospirillaceae bacterium]
MARTAELGNRIELLSMDKNCHDISIGLYEQPAPDGVPEYLVHCFSQKGDVAARLQFIAEAMKVLGGMEGTAAGRLRFACGSAHRLACKRLFLEAGKLASDAALSARPLSIHDKKSGFEITVDGDGTGAYNVHASGDGDGHERRTKAVAGGLRKLAEMAETGAEAGAAFACGQAHDQLVGLLLARALNVRAVLREEDAAAAQGVLAAPSAQSV